MTSHHTFNIEIAAHFKSVNAAVIYHHIQYWVEYNQRSKRNFHDGQYWMYQTLDKMANHFPYLSRDQVKKVINKLVKEGWIIKGNFNKTPFDRTVWYTVNQKNFTKGSNDQMEKVDRPDGEVQTTRPIPDTKTDAEEKNNKEYSSDNSESDSAPSAQGSSDTRKARSEHQTDFVFSKERGRFVGISDEDIEDWKIAYPNIQVRTHIARAEQWLKSNPRKQNKKLWRKFLTTWFQNADTHTDNRKAYRSSYAGSEVDRRTQNVDGTPVDSPMDGVW